MTDQTTSETEIHAATRAERTDLAALLGALTPEQWDAPSLCAGWRTREVVAHQTMPFRMSPAQFALELAKSGGRFDHMADRVARRDAARLTADDLLALLRDNLDHPWSPPGGGAMGALSHDVIHGLDWTVALGLDRRVPPERMALVVGGINARSIRFFGTDLDGVSLRATDLDWTHGDGVPLRGLAQDLLLVLCGRTLPAGRLEGEPAGRFSR